jgi:hypothetical protein
MIRVQIQWFVRHQSIARKPHHAQKEDLVLSIMVARAGAAASEQVSVSSLTIKIKKHDGCTRFIRTPEPTSCHDLGTVFTPYRDIITLRKRETVACLDACMQERADRMPVTLVLERRQGPLVESVIQKAATMILLQYLIHLRHCASS